MQTQRPDNQADQDEEDGLLHSPQRRGAVSVKQFLRGKIPGHPG